MAQDNSQCEAPLWQRTDPDQQALSHILRHLKEDISLMGCISLGKDGILRSLTADRKVLDAAPLSPKLIAALHRRMPVGYTNSADWEGVDGTKTAKEAWLNPDKSQLPDPLTKESIERGLEALTKNPENSNKKREELRKVWEDAGCEPYDGTKPSSLNEGN